MGILAYSNGWKSRARPDSGKHIVKGEGSDYETDFYAMRPILITDFTSEISDGDDKLNSVKFTWRFTDNLPYISMPETPGIFNGKFNPIYS